MESLKPVDLVSLSNDGILIAVAYRDGSVCVWTADKIEHLCLDHYNHVSNFKNTGREEREVGPSFVFKLTANRRVTAMVWTRGDDLAVAHARMGSVGVVDFGKLRTNNVGMAVEGVKEVVMGRKQGPNSIVCVLGVVGRGLVGGDDKGEIKFVGKNVKWGVKAGGKGKISGIEGRGR